MHELASREPTPRPDTIPRLSVRNASKTFGVTTVLDRVSLDIAPGEVHAVLGENGSGKSTLIKLLSGFHSPDPGASFVIDGERFGPPVRPWGWQGSRLAFVHQDLGLVEELSVMDNVRLGRYQRNRLSRRIKVRSERERVAGVLAGLGSTVRPDRLVSSLNFSDRATVAIARAVESVEVSRACVVFDESTRSLPPDALDGSYGLVRQLVEQGSSVLFVSHRLDEVLQLAHRVTVLRDGSEVATTTITPETTEGDLAELLLGGRSRRGSHYAAEAAPTTAGAEVVLEAKDLAGERLSPLSAVLHAGEVLGVTGITESGYDEVPYLLAGAHHGRGTVTVGGRPFDMTSAGVLHMIAAGILLVPEDRAAQGLALMNTVLENLTLMVVDRRPHGYYVSRKAEQRDFRAAVEDVDLRPARAEIPAWQLSGGNQQKLLLAKALLARPKVLVVHEPTQGVDVGARRELLAALRAVARRGTSVIVCSMEVSDLVAACDRVLVVQHGARPIELRTPLSIERILDEIYPGRSSAMAGIDRP